MTLFKPVFLTLTPGTTTRNVKSYYAKGGIIREKIEVYYLRVVEPHEATHFLLIDKEEEEEEKWLPEWVSVVNDIPDTYRDSFQAYGKVYPLAGIETVVRLAQEAEDKYQADLQAIKAKKAEEETRKEFYRPKIEATFLANKEKGSFHLKANSIQIRHIHWTTSVSINYDKLEREGISYLETLIQQLVSKRNQVAECWDKEAQRDNLKEAVSKLLPKELTIYVGNHYKVFIKSTIPFPGDNFREVNNLEEVPGIVAELLHQIKEYQKIRVRKEALRKANKPIPKTLR